LNEAVEQSQKHCGADTYVQAVALPGESYDAECNSDYRCCDEDQHRDLNIAGAVQSGIPVESLPDVTHGRDLRMKGAVSQRELWSRPKKK